MWFELLQLLCVACCADLSQVQLPCQCRHCGLPVCDNACSTASVHQPECQVFRRAKYKVPIGENRSKPLDPTSGILCIDGSFLHFNTLVMFSSKTVIDIECAYLLSSTLLLKPLEIQWAVSLHLFQNVLTFTLSRHSNNPLLLSPRWHRDFLPLFVGLRLSRTEL